MGTLWQDIQFGLRQLGKNPGFTTVMVLVLALGISVSVTIFGLVDWRLRPPSPFAQPEQIVHLSASSETAHEEDLSYLDFLALREQLKSLSETATVSYDRVILKKEGWSWEYGAAEVSRNYFSVGRVRAHRGNVFSERDEAALSDQPGVVLSHRLWRAQFGSDPAIIGRSILLDDTSRVVLGIAPPGFHFVSTIEGGPVVDVWIPLNPQDMQADDTFEEVVGRLKSGSSLPTLKMEMESAFQRLKLRNPHTLVPLKPLVLSDREYRCLGGYPAVAVFVMGLGYTILLIACLNVSGSLLAKADDRRTEMAVRQALGGSRLRLVRQLLAEGASLAFLALGVSLLVSYWFMNVTRSQFPQDAAPLCPERFLTPRVVVFSFAIACIGTLLFELLPIRHACRTNLIPALKGNRSDSSPWGRGHSGLSTLVVFQLAMALVLTVCAGLLLRSYLKAASLDRGLPQGNVLLARLEPGGRRNQRQAFFTDLLTHVRMLSGVKNVGLGLRPPTDSGHSEKVYRVSLPGDQAPAEGQAQAVQANVVNPGYFPAAGIAIVRGNNFPKETGPSDSRQVIINEAFASRFWPGADPVGRFIQLRDADDGQAAMEVAQVVGVVRDIRSPRLDDVSDPYLYVPLGQAFPDEMTLLVETQGDPRLLADPVRDIIQRLDGSMPVFPMTTLVEEIERRTNGRASDTKLIGFLSLLGMALASIGLYGIVAFTVSRRTHELGVRIALGARSRDIMRMVMGQGLKLSLIGLGLGLIGSSILSHILRAVLFGVGPLDPIAFAGASTVLVATALLASYLPARRAARTDPMEVLRYE